MCSVAVRAGRARAKEELAARHGRGRNFAAPRKVEFVSAVWTTFSSCNWVQKSRRVDHSQFILLS